MKSITQLENWFEVEMPQILDRLHPETQPDWGRMNATQMLDHLTDAFKLSMAEYELPSDTIHEKSEKYKNIGLLSDRPLPKGFDNPILKMLFKTSEPEFENAIQGLINQYAAFKLFFETNPQSLTPHNMFGRLKYHEWLVFHYKHAVHHFAQFNLIPYQDKIDLE